MESVQSTDLRPSMLMTQPGPLLSLELTQLTDYSVDVRLPRHDRSPVCPQQEIRKLQGIFDEPDFLIDLLDGCRRFPRPFLLARIVRIHQRRAVPLMGTGPVNSGVPLLGPAVTNLM